MSLEQAIIDLREKIYSRERLLQLSPKSVIIRPSELMALGLTFEDVMGIIKRAEADLKQLSERSVGVAVLSIFEA